jgi:hypothetical protein
MFVATYFRISIAVLVLLWTGLPITAQDPNNGTPTEATPNPGEPPKEAQPNEKKEESKEDPPPKVIRRDEVKSTDKPAEPLTAQVDSDGKVSFQFRDQGWVELVQWLADISDQPIDWLELPGDKVNLRSPGKYTVVETQDLFNRHLLARGYTLLDVDGGLTIVRTKTINPSIIQRVDEAELKGLPDYTFVRSTLDAGWLSATKLAEEFKPMLSSGGVLTPLATTNQIEAMDRALDRDTAKPNNARDSGSRVQAALLTGRESKNNARRISRHIQARHASIDTRTNPDDAAARRSTRHARVDAQNA